MELLENLNSDNFQVHIKHNLIAKCMIRKNFQEIVFQGKHFASYMYFMYSCFTIDGDAESLKYVMTSLSLCWRTCSTAEKIVYMPRWSNIPLDNNQL
jgi:hypothetical protein